MGFNAGKANKILIKLSGQAQFTELCDFRHGWNESDEGHEVTSSCHDGVQAFVASILRGEGDASFHIKDDQYPWSIGIRAQATGMFQVQFGNAQAFTIPFFMNRVGYVNEVAGGTDAQVSFKLNAEAGTYSRPS
jgi:hypothetical protein